MSDKKSVAKSIRLTQELYNFINNYKGDGFNEKFSNIITFCFKKEKELNKVIAKRTAELDSLNAKIAEKRVLLETLNQLEMALNRAGLIAENLENKNT
ncbi:MAG: hypothetical protein K2H01_11300 [Ruminococcus sp.]|nr:hypothetical protein [Ruminococcus sp.]